MEMIVRRGDVFYANLDPARGSEQGGRRPVVVIQNDTGNKHSATTIVAAVTSRGKRNLSTHALLPPMPGLANSSVALLEQVRTVDKSRLEDKLGQIGPNQMHSIDIALAISMGMKGIPGDFMLLTLCRSCMRAYRDSGNYLVRLADPEQEIRERCTLCNVRMGYDYKVIKK